MKQTKTLIAVVVMAAALAVAPNVGATEFNAQDDNLSERPCNGPVDVTCDWGANHCNIYVEINVGPINIICL